MNGPIVAIGYYVMMDDGWHLPEYCMPKKFPLCHAIDLMGTLSFIYLIHFSVLYMEDRDSILEYINMVLNNITVTVKWSHLNFYGIGVFF